MHRRGILEWMIFRKGTNAMKTMFARMLALFMALLIMLSPLGSLAISSEAEEIQSQNAYVLQYDPSELTTGYEYNKPYLYVTPFTVDHTVTREDGSTYYSGRNFPEVFNLINTTKLAAGGEGAYASIAAYCTDASTGLQENAVYRRINLEDSSYYASGAAGRIRAVMLNSFPRLDVASIEAAANVYLNANGYPQIVDLQSGEAILATQLAIWKLANGGYYTINRYFAGMQDLTESWLGDYLDSTVYHETVDQQEAENTAVNIESLFTYLYNLAPEAPRYDAVSEASFETPVYSAVQEADGTYTVNVSVYVNTMLFSGDELTLTATCQEQSSVQTVDAAGTYSVTFTGATERAPVQLELNGFQHGGDVYLFDAEGDRRASQTLVGYDDSLLPVHGEIVVSPDRILNIYKSTSEETGKKPLANIVFDIYKVATMDQLAKGEITLSEEPTDAEIAEFRTPENLIATLTTDVQGFATYNFTDNEMPDGVYMVAERFSAATTGEIRPFFIAVPGTLSDGSGFAYTLNVNPKNTTEVGPNIQKDVTKIDNNSDSFDVNAIHTWIIRGGVPAGLASAQKYEITDTLDYRLTYQKGSPVVKLFAKDGTELTLEANTHYTLTEGKVTEGEHTVDQFRVALTPAGMAYVMANLGSGENTPEIRVYFNAVINQNAAMGEQIPNDAHLDYTNSAGVDYDADSDVPEVHTGGVNILKTDAAGVTLSGAVFKIARLATQDEIDAGLDCVETLNVGQEQLQVVFVEFYPTRDLSGEKVTEVTTDENGDAAIYGLAYGTYYIVETKAPAGFNLLTQPIAVIINDVSHLTAADGWEDSAGSVVDNTLHIINTKFVLPDTGGMGTTVFTVVGLGIIAAAGMLLLINRKRKTC